MSHLLIIFNLVKYLNLVLMNMWYLQWKNSFLTSFVCMNEDYNLKNLWWIYDCNRCLQFKLDILLCLLDIGVCLKKKKSENIMNHSLSYFYGTWVKFYYDNFKHYCVAKCYVYLLRKACENYERSMNIRCPFLWLQATRFALIICDRRFLFMIDLNDRFIFLFRRMWLSFCPINLCVYMYKL